MIPIAWAVVEVENEECWTWFVKIFLEELGVTDGQGLAFINDQQKALISKACFLYISEANSI